MTIDAIGLAGEHSGPSAQTLMRETATAVAARAREMSRELSHVTRSQRAALARIRSTIIEATFRGEGRQRHRRGLQPERAEIVMQRARSWSGVSA